MQHSPFRLLCLILAGLLLVSAAWGLRSSRWLREPVLRGKDLPQLEALVEKRPEDALARYYLAKGYYLNGRFAEAEAAYEAAARLDPGSARAHLGLALASYERGKMRQARAEFERALQLDNRLAWAEYMLGRLLWLEGDVKAALPHVRRSTELDPRSDQAWYGLGVCYTQFGRHSEAITALRRALNARGDSAKYHTALGELLVFVGQMEEGRQHYERALQLDPNYGPACALLGKFYLRNAAGPDSLARAEELLKRATRRETMHPADVWFDLGQLYIQKAQYKKAIEPLQESLRKDARDERAYYALANAYRRMGEAQKAAATEARFRRISALHVRMQGLRARITHSPGNASTHLELARVYRDLGLDQQAAEHYVAAARLEPLSVRITGEWEQFLQKHAQAQTDRRNQGFVLPSPR